jgi:CRP-like cAMP-binding protein
MAKLILCPDGDRPFERNCLLRAMPVPHYRRLAASLEEMPLVPGQVLYQPGHTISHVYFPQTAVVSVICVPDPRAAIEVAMVGREGFIGLPIVRDVPTTAVRYVVQVGGAARRLRAEALEDAIQAHDGLRPVITRFGQALFDQVALCAGCNVGHPPRQRCARWMLMLHDRVDGDEIPVTQEFLGYMLGMSRQTVSAVARTLQRDRLIEYTRGKVRIVRRAALEKLACGCYRPVANRLRQLVGTVSGMAVLATVGV